MGPLQCFEQLMARQGEVGGYASVDGGGRIGFEPRGEVAGGFILFGLDRYHIRTVGSEAYGHCQYQYFFRAHCSLG